MRTNLIQGRYMTVVQLSIIWFRNDVESNSGRVNGIQRIRELRMMIINRQHVYDSI